jgi:hypothetical protein
VIDLDKITDEEKEDSSEVSEQDAQNRFIKDE